MWSNRRDKNQAYLLILILSFFFFSIRMPYALYITMIYQMFYIHIHRLSTNLIRNDSFIYSKLIVIILPLCFSDDICLSDYYILTYDDI